MAENESRLVRTRPTVSNKLNRECIGIRGRCWYAAPAEHLHVRYAHVWSRNWVEMCTTPPYSPESNGMAESFAKSFKRATCTSRTCGPPPTCCARCLLGLTTTTAYARTKACACFHLLNSETLNWHHDDWVRSDPGRLQL